MCGSTIAEQKQRVSHGTTNDSIIHLDAVSRLDLKRPWPGICDVVPRAFRDNKTSFTFVVEATRAFRITYALSHMTLSGSP